MFLFMQQCKVLKLHNHKDNLIGEIRFMKINVHGNMDQLSGRDNK